MLSAIVIHQSGATPEHTKKAVAGAMASALEDGAIHYHANFMPKHFTIAGAREYGYSPRKGAGLSGRDFWRSYEGKKKRQKGHQRPLVWSGASEQLARIRDIRTTRRRARIVQHARGLNRRNPNSAINTGKEIRTVSRTEAVVINSVVGRSLVSRLRTIPKRSRRKIA